MKINYIQIFENFDQPLTGQYFDIGFPPTNKIYRLSLFYATKNACRIEGTTIGGKSSKDFKSVRSLDQVAAILEQFCAGGHKARTQLLVTLSL